MQNVPKRGPGPHSPTSPRLMAGLCEQILRPIARLKTIVRFHRPWVLDCAAAGGRAGAEGALVVFQPQSVFSSRFCTGTPSLHSSASRPPRAGPAQPGASPRSPGSTRAAPTSPAIAGIKSGRGGDWQRGKRPPK